MKIKSFVSFAMAAASCFANSQVSVTTYHNDNLRTGLNSSETLLTPSNVNSTTFGMLYAIPVDGYVYAEPLYLPAVTIPGKGVHNVLYVATQHNSVYAFDADGNQGANSVPLWHVNLGPSVPYGDTGSSDIAPEIGITTTPVILPSKTAGVTGTLYLVAKTKTYDANNNPIYKNTLHALDVTTGAEKFGGPVTVQATVTGSGDGNNGANQVPFNALIQNCRPALLMVANGGGSTGSGSNPKLTSNTIYLGFASHGDNGPYHGWLFGYNAANLQQTSVLNTSPNALTDPSGYPLAAGGIWQSGAGMASDGTSLFFSTGNGTFDPTTGAYGDSILRCSLNPISVQDYFAPSDQLSLDYADGDLGSGGVMLLPPTAGSKANPNLLVQSGKEGTLYLLNTQNLGKYNPSGDKVVQELPQVMGGIWGAPAYFNGNIYYGPVYSSILSVPISAGVMATSPANYTSVGYAYPGPTPAISSNGTSNGIVWAIQTDNWGSQGPANLQAYNAANLATLYNSSDTQGRDTMGPATKFTVPTVANGKVYAGTGTEVDVFGLGKWTAAPVIVQASGNYVNSVSVTINDSTSGAKIYYTTDGTTPTPASTLYKGPVTFTNSVTLTARAYATGYGTSAQVVANYQINAVIGTGTGLPGYYYNATQTPTGTVTAKRLDPVINFNWNGNSPIAGVDGTNWAAQWVGGVQAECDGPYTFYTNSDDGVQLYINGKMVINDFTNHPPTIDQATVTLVHGVKYNVTIKYFQGGGGSLLQLFWSAPGMPMQIIPKSQLY